MQDMTYPLPLEINYPGVITNVSVDDILNHIGMPMEKYLQVNDSITKTDDGHWILENVGHLRYGYRHIGWRTPDKMLEIRASRLSYMLSRRVILPPWQHGHPEVCHGCFLRECFAPLHTYLGTRTDNASDKWNQRWTPEGRANTSFIKRTEEEVREIFRLVHYTNTSFKDIDQQFNMSSGSAALIGRGGTWRHVTQPLLDALPPNHQIPYRIVGKTKLTLDQVRELHDLAKSGIRWKDIKDQYPIGYNAFLDIKNGKTWKPVLQK